MKLHKNPTFTRLDLHNLDYMEICEKKKTTIIKAINIFKTF